MKNLTNTLILNISQIVSIFLSLFFQFYIFKIFNEETVGEISIFFALTNILSNICCFGMNNFIISSFSDNVNKFKENQSNLTIHIIFSSIISLLLYILISTFLIHDLLFIISFFPMILSLAFLASLSSFIQLEKRFLYVGILMPIIPAIKCLSLIIAIIFENKLYIYLFSNLTLTSMFTIFLAWKLKKYISINNIDIKNYYTFIKNIYPYGLLNLCFLLYTNASIVILGFFGMKEEAAYLNITYLIINCLVMIPTMMIQKIYAADIYKLLKEDFKRLETLKNKIIIYLLIYGFVITFTFIFMGKFFINILFNENADYLFITTSFLLISFSFRLMNLINGTILTAVDYVKRRLKIEIMMSMILLIGISITASLHNFLIIMILIVIIDISWSIAYASLLRRIRKERYDEGF